MEWPDGASYDGLWSKGKRLNGKMIYADGSFYEGTLIDEKYVFGKITWANGDSYNGIFDGDGKQLIGVYNKKNEYVFKGDWNKGVRKRGIKIQENASGAIVTVYLALSNSGIYEDAVAWQRLFDDEGRVIASYVGDFVMGQMSGWGQMRTDWYVYTGEWLNGQANGMGTQVYVKTGSRAYGYFEDMSLVREYSLPELGNYTKIMEYIEQATLNLNRVCEVTECDQFMKEHGIIPK